MKLTINLDDMREKRNLYIATPAYGGNIHPNFNSSMLQLQKMFMEFGLAHTIQYMYNESLVPRARNTLANMFLQSECTDMLFIDSDIEFEAKDVISMLHFDKDVIGGMYPLKSIEWDYVKEAVLKNPNIDPTDLAYQGVRWSGHPFKGNLNMASEEPIEVEELATGFLMIKRGVFKALDAISPTYTPAVDDKVAKGKPVKDYFEVGVVNDRYESEDYSFCRKYRETGGKIYMCPWINLVHHGSHPFKGNLVKVAQGLGTIN